VLRIRAPRGLDRTRSYLARNAELGYGGNVHVAQGRTVDTAHLLVTDSLSRQALYVGMTRGREADTAHVITGKTAPPGREPYQQAAPESVLVSVMQRDAGDLSATEQIRHAQDWAGGTPGRMRPLSCGKITPGGLARPQPTGKPGESPIRSRR
jgi:hypothetical protein